MEQRENERAVHQRAAALAAAERAFQGSTIELSVFYRSSNGSPALAAEGRLPAFPEPPPRVHLDRVASVRTALQTRPELRRLAAASEQTRIDRRLADNQRQLGVDVSAAVVKDFGVFPNDDKRLKPEVELGLLIDVPILTRAQDGRVDAAEATLRRLTAQDRLQRDRIVAEVQDAATAMEQSAERLGHVRREIATAKALLDAEVRRFALGEGTLLFVNLRETALAEAEIREVDVLSDYHKAVASLQAATSQPGPRHGSADRDPRAGDRSGPRR